MNLRPKEKMSANATTLLTLDRSRTAVSLKAVHAKMLTLFLALLLLSSTNVRASTHKKIMAFFQGTCDGDLCDQLCVDITGGGFVCDCYQGWKLTANGRDCVVDNRWSSEQQVPQPVEKVSQGRQPQATDNQSGQTSSSLLETGSMDVKGTQLADKPQGPVALRVSSPSNDVLIHSLDMKPGLEQPQSLYQLREGGSDSRELTGELLNNVWPENNLPFTAIAGEEEEHDDSIEPPHVMSAASGASACQGIMCMNNGSCVVDNGYARCNCLLGFTGSYCERELEVRFPRFRGYGFLAMPVLRDGYKEFAVALEFRPEGKNGLLLFSSEFEDARKDFFAITLVNGFVEFRFDCGSGPALLISPQPAKMGNWNQVIVARNDNHGSLQLNTGQVVRGAAQGEYTRITLRQNLYVGGYSNMTAITSRVNTDKAFVGCVQHLIINGYRYDFRKAALVGDSDFGINVGDCSEGICDNTVCQNSGTCHAKTADTTICLCPLGFHGDMCEKETPVRIPHFNGHSHLQFQGLGRTVLAYTEVEAVIKPEALDGVIVYNGYTHDRKGDFISLSLRNGYVEFSFDLGTGPAIIRSPETLKLHQWHVIRASRTGLEGILQINEGPEVRGQSQGAYTQLTLLQNLFLGGHNNFDHTSRHANLSSSFVGCIQKLSINKHPLSILEDHIGGHNVEPCPHPCAGEPCMNSGECYADGEVYKCSCPIGFSNTNCEDKVEQLPTKPMFSGSSYLAYSNRDIVKRVTGNRMDLQLYIKPKSTNGMLFWSGQELQWDGMEQSTSNFDFVSLGFVDGSLQLRYNLGSGEAVIGYNESRLFDGQWHFVRVQRDNQDAYMEVDLKEIVEGSAPGTYTILNTNRMVYLGGMPDVARLTGRRFTSNYEGCIRDVLLATDFQVKLLQHAHSGRNIEQCRRHL